jgi:hypothetical protein
VGAGTTLGGLTSYRSYLRFDQITRTVPAGAVEDQATLYLDHLGSPGNLIVVAAMVTETWTEAGITWHNQPGRTVPQASTTVSLTIGVHRWGVTVHVQAWVDGAPAPMPARPCPRRCWAPAGTSPRPWRAASRWCPWTVWPRPKPAC